MAVPTIQLRYAAAAGILAAGLAWAAEIHRQPPAVPGPKPAQLRAWIERVPAVDSGPALAAPVAVRRASLAPSPRTRRTDAPAARPATRPQPPPAPASPAQPAEPLTPPAVEPSQLALLGITQRDSVRRVWLVDLETQERAIAEEGETAFGWEVREIRPESVRLAFAGEELSLRLGERPIPTRAPEVEAPAEQNRSAVASAASGAGRGRFRRGGDSRRFASTGSSGWRGGRSSLRTWGRNRGSSGRSWSFSRRFTPGIGGRAFSGGRWISSRPTAPRVTSNPQTARRTGARLTGGMRPLPEPRPIVNPQTQRRRGTNSGVAFGEDRSERNRRS